MSTTDINDYDDGLPDGNEVAAEMMNRVNRQLADEARDRAVRDNPDLAPFADLLVASDAESMRALTDDLSQRLRRVTANLPPVDPAVAAERKARQTGMVNDALKDYMRAKGIGNRSAR